MSHRVTDTIQAQLRSRGREGGVTSSVKCVYFRFPFISLTREVFANTLLVTGRLRNIL